MHGAHTTSTTNARLGVHGEVPRPRTDGAVATIGCTVYRTAVMLAR